VAAALAFASGFVDVIGWLALDHLYTTHMTGNSAALGQALQRGDLREVVKRGLPAAVFVAGVTGGAALAEHLSRRGLRATVAPGLALTGALLGVFVLWANETARHGVVPLEPAWAFDAQASLVSLAMGVQTATFRRIDGATVRTTYITGMLTNFGEELVELLTRRREGRDASSVVASRLVAVGVIWPSFVVGAAAGAVGHVRWQTNALLAPLALLAALALLDLVFPVGGPTGSVEWRREQRRRSGE
jgi:uncharacterized membrane protein YoaK (UPF0700 family)